MKSRKVKISIGIGIIIFICVSTYVGMLWYLHEKKLSETLFGIDERDYKIVLKKNTLELTEYGGMYMLELRVGEKDAEEFVEKIESRFLLIYPEASEETERFDELEKELIRNITGWVISEDDKVYACGENIKRKAIALVRPKSIVECYAILSQNKDNSYDAYLLYIE